MSSSWYCVHRVDRMLTGSVFYIIDGTCRYKKVVSRQIIMLGVLKRTVALS